MRRAFTLIELLVVIVIILLVSASVLPMALGALGQRRVGEAARILQAAIVGARDLAIHVDHSAGVRLLPDETLPAGTLGANRLVATEQGPDYSEGNVVIHGDGAVVNAAAGLWGDPYTLAAYSGYLVLWQAPTRAIAGTTVANSPTSWAWNVRIGERVTIGQAGRTFVVVGPTVVPPGLGNPAARPPVPPNPEGFVNYGAPGTLPPVDPQGLGTRPEFLYLVDGRDDDGDGWADEGWDNLDNDLDGVIDNEVEREDWGILASSTAPFLGYAIARRPVPVQGAREVSLPAGVVVDMTAWNTTGERSRAPIDPYTGALDILVDGGGRLVPSSWHPALTVRNGASAFAASLIHLWLADREDVHAPGEVWGFAAAGTPNPNPNAAATPPQAFQLPLPSGAPDSLGVPSYPPVPPPAGSSPVVLTGERRLLTMFTRTGLINVNSIESFNVNDVNAPFYDAQAAIREAK